MNFHFHCSQYHLIVYCHFLHQNMTCHDIQHLKYIKLKGIKFITTLPVVEYPNCLHTTSASLLVQPSSQIVPQVLLRQISRRPSLSEVPLTKRISPSEQSKTITKSQAHYFLHDDSIIPPLKQQSLVICKFSIKLSVSSHSGNLKLSE